MRVQTADYQTVEFCYPLSAVGFPRGREMVRLSDFRLAWYLETYSLLTASHIKVGDFSTPLRCARNDMKGRSAARVQMVQRVQRFKGWWWRLRRSIQAPSWGRGLTLRVFTAASYAVGYVEAGDFEAPLPTLEMTGGGAFRMKMTKRSVNGNILFLKLWKMKSFGNRIFT